MVRALADPEATDLGRPDRADRRSIDEIGALLELHPLIAEDIAERNQRAKFEEVEGTVHLVMFAVAYEGEVSAHRGGPGANQRSLLTVHDAGWDPFTLTQLRSDPAACSRAAPTSSCTRSPTASWTATSRPSTRSRTRSTRSRTT